MGLKLQLDTDTSLTLFDYSYISLFTDVIDFFVNGFADVDSSVDIEKDLTEDEIESLVNETRQILSHCANPKLLKEHSNHLSSLC